MSTPLSSSTSHSRSQSSSTPVANSAFEDYHRQMNQVLDHLDDKLQQYPIVQQIAGQTKVRPSYLAVGLVVALILFIFWGFGGRLVANIVGFGYPLYESFHSLKRKPLPGEVDEEDSQWLTYWVVYSTFTLLESFSNFLELWIPFYHLVKVAFLLWCFLPQTRGALYIYHHVIEPVLVRYESSIDAGRSKVKKSVTTVAKDMAEIGAAAIEAKTREVAQSAINSMISGQQSAAPGGPETEHTKSM